MRHELIKISTCKKARTLVDPATESAEQTRNPVSSRSAPCIFNVPSDSTWKWPYAFPANINTWEPSFVQKTEGEGFPLVRQENVAIPFNPTVWFMGTFTNEGGAVKSYCNFLIV